MLIIVAIPELLIIVCIDLADPAPLVLILVNGHIDRHIEIALPKSDIPSRPHSNQFTLWTICHGIFQRRCLHSVLIAPSLKLDVFLLFLDFPRYFPVGLIILSVITRSLHNFLFHLFGHPVNDLLPHIFR